MEDVLTVNSAIFFPCSSTFALSSLSLGSSTTGVAPSAPPSAAGAAPSAEAASPVVGGAVANDRRREKDDEAKAEEEGVNRGREERTDDEDGTDRTTDRRAFLENMARGGEWKERGKEESGVYRSMS